jgi:pentatricopeptide repeat protein
LSKVYNCLLDACIECKALPRALKIFEEMKEQSLADVVSYNTIMKGLATPTCNMPCFEVTR